MHPGSRDHARLVLESPRRLVPALRRRTAISGLLAGWKSADGKSKDWRDWKGGCHGYEGLLCDGFLALLCVADDLAAGK